MLSGKNIVIGVSGGIAAFKSCILCSLLQKAGAHVRVIMTENATKFVTPLTFETLTGHEVVTSNFNSIKAWEINHINWSKWADLVIIAPASANIIAKCAHGIADDALSTFLLAISDSTPLFIVPAMNTAMWKHIATQTNIELVLKRNNVHLIEPTSGKLACGDIGTGKMQEPELIVKSVHKQISLCQKLAGKTVLITSGPTREFIDPVRYISSPSSGKMGKALAETALAWGANKVHFVTGPVGAANMPMHSGKATRINVIPVTTAQEMLEATLHWAKESNVLIFAAAVSDYRNTETFVEKLKREGNATKELILHLIENPDISFEICKTKTDKQVAIGFAAETQCLDLHAQGKLKRKNLDMIVANDVSDSSIGFNSDENAVTCYFKTNRQPVHLEQASKQRIAEGLWQLISGLL